MFIVNDCLCEVILVSSVELRMSLLFSPHPLEGAGYNTHH